MQTSIKTGVPLTKGVWGGTREVVKEGGEEQVCLHTCHSMKGGPVKPTASSRVRRMVFTSLHAPRGLGFGRIGL